MIWVRNVGKKDLFIIKDTKLPAISALNSCDRKTELRCIFKSKNSFVFEFRKTSNNLQLCNI